MGEVQMKEWRRWMPVLTVVALGAIVSLVGSASARSIPTVKSTVTITSGEGAEFTGKVSAAKKKCRAGRTVKLFREAGSSRTADPIVGTARTNATGAWTMDGSFLAGVYYARVVAALIHINGMAYRCGGDFSIRQHF
jgi:hypothetical protein